MKKLICASLIAASLLITTSSVYAWGPYYGPPPRHYGHGYHHSNVGDVIGGVILGGLVVGGIAAAMNPQPVQYVSQPVYVAPPAPVVVQQPRTCVEERRVSGEYQVLPDGSRGWVTFPYPVVRRYEVPCN
jgi:hypothetical protein